MAESRKREAPQSEERYLVGYEQYLPRVLFGSHVEPIACQQKFVRLQLAELEKVWH